MKPLMSPQAPQRVGPYRLEQLLGTGGMGKVWRAWDERLKRTVAIKHILAEALESSRLRERFRQEATAGARLNHPAIVHIYDIVETEDGDWIVMELVHGRTLRSLLDERPLDPATALRLGSEIAGGLAEAHSHGIIHRDLKSGNIMVTAAGRAKILDFGLAKLIHAEDLDQALSQPGMILGTPYAMSPEQVLGKPLDHRSDLFSFGALLYEMITGVSPFRGESLPVTLSRICTLRQPPLRELQPAAPSEVSQLIDLLLQKEPQQRPQSTAEVAAALAEMAAGLARETGETGGARSSPATGGFEDELGATVAEALRPAAPRSWSEPTALPLEFPLGVSERRQVSVICCGLVEILDGSGEWSSPGLENLSEAMPELRGLAHEVATRFEGHLGTTLGHLLWIYFGYPTAHGDDAQRAIRAARELVARVGGARWAQGKSSRLALRAGVHSGPAIVSKDPRQSEHLALGPTLDLATGLQSLAPAHGVLVSDLTQRLIARSFLLEALPPARLPGFAEPVSSWQVSAPLEALDKTPIALTPLVGRDKETDLVLQRWHLAEAGEGQALLVGGEAGVGKSRLIRAFRERLPEQGFWWLACYGSAYARSSPFFPVIDLLRRQWLQPAASPEEELARLEDLLRRNDLPVADTLPLFAELLSLPLPESCPPLALSPEAQRKRTLEALVQLFLQAADRQPGILVVEDLHWLDPSTLAWIGALLEALGATPLLLILTFRLELQIPWVWRSHWTQLSLSRLGDAEAGDLVDRIAGGLAGPHRLGPEIRRQIIARSDGIPLFIEELTKSAVESAEASGQSSSQSFSMGIPSLLRDSLTARLDRMGMAKEVAQLAAVIGRVFSFELISAVSPFDPATLQRELDRLVKAELVYRKGIGARSQYLFKHALLQDAACELLLPRDFQRLHQKVAEALETRFPETVAAQPELLAHHLTQGDQPEKAIGYWLQAGQRAFQRFANQEAAEHFQEGLRCIDSLPAGPERDRLELLLHMSLGPALVMLRGYSDVQLEASFDRILALSPQLGDLPGGLQSLLWSFYLCRGSMARAEAVARQKIRAGEERQDQELLIAGLQEAASSELYLGDSRAALASLRRARELYAAEAGRPPFFVAGSDSRIHNLYEQGRSLWDAGFPDQALLACQEALHFAESLADPYHSVVPLLYLGYIHHHRREDEEAARYAQRMHALCIERGFAFFVDHSRFMVGLTEASAASLGEASSALEALREIHRQQMNLPSFLGWLAEAALLRGLTAEAGRFLAQAHRIREQTGERFGIPELHRLEGVLALAQQREDAAEECFQKALAEARSSGSLSLELRAAIDLGRLWNRQEKSEPARQLVAGVVERFTEGWETSDLRAARFILHNR